MWQRQKTKQFCEISSIFYVDNIKNKAILQDLLQKWKVECRADGLVPMRFAIFSVHVSKVLRLPGKSEAKSYEVLHLSRKIILASLKNSCSKMQPLSGNLRPDLLTHLTHVSLVLRLPREMHLSRSSSNVPRLPSFLKLLQAFTLLTFHKVHNPLRLPRKRTSERPKVFCTFDLEMCFAPQRRALFRHINFQKCSVPFSSFTFDLEMCFAPQRRALFRHINFQKCSVPLSSFTVLRATTACTFSTSQLPKVVRSWCALYILTWKCASRHNGHKSLEKHNVSRLSYFFTHLHLLSSYSFSSTLLSSNLSLLSASSLLCFSSVQIVGSLTSKLPSIISYHVMSCHFISCHIVV